PKTLDPELVQRLIDQIAARRLTRAFILTSFHQSPLPLALLLRQAGVPWIGATCVDYPGSLLDLRYPYREELHEVEQALALCAAAGYSLPDGDLGHLRLRLPPSSLAIPSEPYIVV